MFFTTTDLCLDNDGLSNMKRTGPICLALVNVIAGRLADEIWMDFKIFKTFHRLDFYFVNITAMLLIVLEVHFSQLFS